MNRLRNYYVNSCFRKRAPSYLYLTTLLRIVGGGQVFFEMRRVLMIYTPTLY